MFAHLAEAEAICHTLQEIGLSPSFKQRQWEVWPGSFTISQSHFYEALSSKVYSLHWGRILWYVTVQSIHWRFWSFKKVLILTSLWKRHICVSWKKTKKKPELVRVLKVQLACHSSAVSHSSLFMSLKRGVMEHVKERVFIGQLWKEARSSQLSQEGNISLCVPSRLC